MNSSPDELALGKRWYHRRAMTFFVLTTVFLSVALCAVPLVIFAPEEKGLLIGGGIGVALGVIPFFFCWLWARRKERDPLAVLLNGSEVLGKKERRG